MTRRFVTTLYLLIGIFPLAAFAAYAQTAKSESKDPPTARVALYRVAPGKHLDFLKWMAENDAIEKEAGVPGAQMYAHTNGDSWDYMQIIPIYTKEQQAKIDEVSKKRGRKVGAQASLEFRMFIAWHTDTDTVGPMTATEFVAMSSK